VGLPPAAISLVFKAFYGFGAKLDKLGVILALCSCLGTILINGDENIRPDSSQYVFPSMLAVGGLITFVDSKRKSPFSNYGSPSKGWDAEDEAHWYSSLGWCAFDRHVGRYTRHGHFAG